MTVVLDSVRAQRTAIDTLKKALVANRVHHAYRFEGPDGVGKELAAIGLAQALLCETKQGGLACGACSSCRRSVERSADPPIPLHPDFVILERGLYAPDAIGRSRPEITELSVDQIRALVLSKAAYPPVEGIARVILVRRAEELSTGAANALLKTLEEPGQGTHFVLLTSQRDRLLPTILSRTLPLRFGPLPDDVLTELAPSPPPADALALCGGSLSALADVMDEAETEARNGFVDAIVASVLAPDLGRATAVAEQRDLDRQRLGGLLYAFEARLSLACRAVAPTDEPAAAALSSWWLPLKEALLGLEVNASASLTVLSLVRRLQALPPLPPPALAALRGQPSPAGSAS